MTFLKDDQKLLVADSQGRVRVPEDRREALLDEFERSGMSGLKFARLTGLKYQTFALWVRQRRAARSVQTPTSTPASEQPMAFVEAMVDPGCAKVGEGYGLAIQLPGGARMQIDSPSQLQMAAELLSILAAAGGR